MNKNRWNRTLPLVALEAIERTLQLKISTRGLQRFENRWTTRFFDENIHMAYKTHNNIVDV